MPYTVAEAAKAIGKSKAAVFRAIRKGTISVTRNESNGVFLIDQAELHRAFPPASTVSADTLPDTTSDTPRLAELQGRLADAHDTIRDLRQRLDAEAQERRRLTAILADQRAKPEPAAEPPAPPRRRWWPWRR